MSTDRTYLDYYVGLICAKPLEAAALTAVLDDVYRRMGRMSGDSNAYTPGRIGEHNVVIARLPAGTPGTTAAAAVAKDMLRTFPNIRIGFFVGIGGGVPGPPKNNPEENIRLGDVVVSHPGDGHGGVIQYDFGKTIQDGTFVTTGYLQRPPDVLLTALSELRTQHDLRGNSISECIRNMSKTYTRMASRWEYPGADRDILYVSEFQHPCRGNTCVELGCATRPERIVNRAKRMTSDPAVHYGLIASANNVMRDSKTRDALREKHGMLCFEMEAAGLMSSFPCLIIRGISDYSDSHKADGWQDYAAAAASAFTKELLQTIPTFDIQQTPTAANSMESSISRLSNSVATSDLSSQNMNASNRRQFQIGWRLPSETSNTMTSARSKQEALPDGF